MHFFQMHQYTMITTKLFNSISFLVAYHQVTALQGRIKDPLRVRYSPRAGGLECGLIINLISDDINVLKTMPPQYHIQ